MQQSLSLTFVYISPILHVLMPILKKLLKKVNPFLPYQPTAPVLPF